MLNSQHYVLPSDLFFSVLSLPWFFLKSTQMHDKDFQKLPIFNVRVDGAGRCLKLFPKAGGRWHRFFSDALKARPSLAGQGSPAPPRPAPLRPKPREVRLDPTLSAAAQGTYRCAWES